MNNIVLKILKMLGDKVVFKYIAPALVKFIGKAIFGGKPKTEWRYDQMKALSGWKTYLAIGIGILAYGLLGMGFISDSLFNAIAIICGFLGIGFLRMGVKKIEKKIK